MLANMSVLSMVDMLVAKMAEKKVVVKGKKEVDKMVGLKALLKAAMSADVMESLMVAKWDSSDSMMVG